MSTERRNKGTGTITEVRPGTWRLRVATGTKPNGQPIQASRTIHGSHKDAQKALARFATEVADNTAPLSGAMTVAQYLNERYLPHLKSTRGPETYRQSVSRSKRICAELGRVRLDRLSAAHLDQAYSKWRADLSASTIRAHHLVISAALTQAIRWGLLARSVAPLATLPRVEQRQDTTPDLEVIRGLVRDTEEDDPVLSAAIMLAALTGARRGELLGLRWSDIDRDRMILTIGRSVKRNHDGTPLVGSTKNHQVRRLSIDEVTLAVLNKHAVRCRSWGLVTEDGYVLTWDPSSQTPSNANMLSAHFRAAADRAGLKGLRFHDLRHAVATTLLSGGYDPMVVAGRLGHSSPNVTLRAYAHVLEQRDRQAAGVMGALLSGK